MASQSAQLSVAPREFTLSGRIVLGLLEAVETAGIPRAQLLLAAQLDNEQLESSEFRLPRSEIYRLCELAIDLTGDPALGLHWAEKLSRDVFNPISYMMANAGSLRSAFEALARFKRLLTDETSYELIESESTVTVRCVSMPGDSPRVQRFTHEMLLISFLRMIRGFSMQARPRRVSFAYAPPSYRAEYTRVFDGAERFRQPYSAIEFDRSLMDAVSPNKDDDVHRALRSIAEQRVLRLAHRVPYAVRVRDFLVQQAPSGRAEMETVARSLGLSVRSLRRRMDAEGYTFFSVANDAQAIVAKNLLRNTERTLKEIGNELGFLDTTSFHRAFKRWTGTTPLAYREAIR